MKYVMHETAYTPFHCNKVQVQFSFRKKTQQQQKVTIMFSNLPDIMKILRFIASGFNQFEVNIAHMFVYSRQLVVVLFGSECNVFIYYLCVL